MSSKHHVIHLNTFSQADFEQVKRSSEQLFEDKKVATVLALGRTFPEQWHLMGVIEHDSLQALVGFFLPPAQLRQAKIFCFVSPADNYLDLFTALLSEMKSLFHVYQIDARVDSCSVDLYRQSGFTCLALRPEAAGKNTFLCCWLDTQQVLEPDFRFPQPPIDTVCLPGTDHAIDVLRLDRIHPLLSGNKWFKLRWNLIQARQNGQRQILTFGGAWSNHIFATAAAGSLLGFKTIGVIRGEEPQALNPILKFARECGMALHFMTRSAYRQKTEPLFLAELQCTYPNALIIPEGGANPAGMLGAQEITTYIPADYTLIVTACGTAATLAGLIVTGQPEQRFLGVSALKGGSFLSDNVVGYLGAEMSKAWELELRYHCRGFAKTTPELLAFLERFQALNLTPIEPIYTAKMLYAISQCYQNGELNSAERVLALQTGGIYPWNHDNYLLQESLFPVLEW